MAKLLRKRFRRVLIDVDTQYDLIYNSDNNIDNSNVLRNIRRLMAWSRVHDIRVISTELTRRADNVVEDASLPKPKCVENTPGHKKIRYTMLSNHVVFGPENRMDLPRHILSDYKQIIFEKRTYNPFVQPRADRLLTELRADEFIIFGFDLKNAIHTTALGLLLRKKKVALVVDAIEQIPRDEFDLEVRKIEAKGAKLIKTIDITGSSSSLIGKTYNKIPWQNKELKNARIR